MLLLLCMPAWAVAMPQADTTKPAGADTLKYPIHDRRGDKYSEPLRNSLNLADPANIRDSVVYDPATRRYYLWEKIGNHYYRSPGYLTFEEYLQWRAKQDENDYFKKRADASSLLNKKLLHPELTAKESFFNRIFGNGKVDVRPQGEVNVSAGYQGQNVKNPSLPESSRKTGGFDFDMNANLSVLANIGNKMKLPISYNTQSNMDFENQLKLDYTGTQDEIIRKIEAGNVSFTTKGSLIQGVQQLFGIKAQLQFGRLSVTGVLANQKSTRQTLGTQGGSSTTSFQFKADDYDENRHFLLAQYFRKNYNKAMANLPVVNSPVQITKMEVWITNKTGATTDARNIVGLMDLGEYQPYNTAAVTSQTGLTYPFNDANNLYKNILSDAGSRSASYITTKLKALGLQQVQDFEKTYARKLSATEYTYNAKAGFISLNTSLSSDDVLAVAFQYTYNGRVYQVGEFAQDVSPDSTGTQKVLFLKLLKATSQRTALPIWDLMMKNVYTLKSASGGIISSVQSGDFQLNVLYDQAGMGQKRYLPEGDKYGIPLITVLNLDRLNSNNDPSPDGMFDYLEGYTVVSSQARVIFPLIEPFGKDLDTIAFKNNPALAAKYTFPQLYDTIKAIAQTYAGYNRFYISGSAKGQSSSELSLGAFNIPQGSVTVTAGSQTLTENVDYIVDYNLGTVKIINQAILNSGVAVTVGYENNGSYGSTQRSFLGLRFDYSLISRPKETLNIGATLERLSERPYFSKVTYGEDPIRNTMYGLDASYTTESHLLTRLLNKLPFYHSNEVSSITAYGEGAFLKPGHASQIGDGTSGMIYIDDFEGSSSSVDLRFPLINWGLASTPAESGMFPEGSLSDSLEYGNNRAKLSWYNIESVLQDKKNTENPVRSYEDLTDPRVRSVLLTQIYPNKTADYGESQLVTFDMAFYPKERGPYNFDATNVAADGKLLNPQKRWGGIMRGIDQTDFETSNIEYIEFWVQDPFLKMPASTGGQLYFNLGSISEDVLKDGKRFFENGISGAVTSALEDSSTVWGKVPANATQVTNAFSNESGDRTLQDAGFDGLSDEAEQRKFKAYLDKLAATFGTNSLVYQNALKDPSSDNYTNYRDATYDDTKTGIIGRYKNVNGPQGNSPISSSGDKYVKAFTLYPDEEDFNGDNTMNELEEYFQYKVDLTPAQLEVGKNFITDIRTFTPSGGTQEKWYLFRIPISEYQQKVGDIPDFKSIRFVRMFMTGFEDSVILRFAKLELVRNQWRQFGYLLDTTGQYVTIPANTTTTVNQLTVNVEENSARSPIVYKTPPDVVRQQLVSNNNTTVLMNEQSLSLQVCNLAKRDVRGVTKTMSLDIRRYGRLQMYIHAEAVNSSADITNNQLYGVIRLGTDLVSNYYEIRIPLAITAWGTTDEAVIWPAQNELNLAMDSLIQLKTARNKSGQTTTYYKETDATGRELAILGNPNLGDVQAFFIGVENRAKDQACTEVWFNELRLSELDESGGWAAMGRLDIKLADLGTVSVSGSAHSSGWGSIDQKVNERAMENLSQLDMAANLELGKLLPKKAGMSIPFYASLSRTVSTPEYDPYDLDIKLKDKLNAASTKQERDSIREAAIEWKIVKTVNFTNVRRTNVSGKKLKPWSIENVDLSYSYYKEEEHTPLIEARELIRHKGSLGYSFTSTPKFWQPVKNIIKSKSPWWSLIKDININPVPSLISFRADINRQFGAYRSRNVGGPKGVLPETFDKYFTFDRTYNLRWDLTRSLNIDFSATNKAWIDEDTGRLDKAEKKSMMERFWKGGRTTSYVQTSNVSYTFPTSKFPLLDWTTIRAGYGSTFNFAAASLLAKNLGNTLANTQQKTLTGEFDFTRLYSKSKWLRAIEEDDAGIAPPGASIKKRDSANRRPVAVKTNTLQLSPLEKFFGRLLTSVKRVGVQYTQNSSATIYGYTDSTHVLGMNFKTGAPGLGFVFGVQPDTGFVTRMAKKGWITADSNFNYQNTQEYSQKLNITAQIVPVRDLVIDLNLDKSFGKGYSELYKDTTGTGSSFGRLSPYSSGSFSVSYISFQTMFQKVKGNEVSPAFKKFSSYRLTLSKRLAQQNEYWKQLSAGSQVQSDGYYTGYGKYAQDVLLPAFIAAYTGKDPENVALIKQSNSGMSSNPFSGILPRPNWNITYTGLTRLQSLRKIFSNFTITHGYNSTLSMNSFSSSLLYQDSASLGYPSFIDTTTGNFIPYFTVPNVSISEQFSPLIGIDVQFVNQVTARFEYRKSRQLSLSLTDYQLSESRSNEIVLGAGFRKRGLFSFIRLKGKALSNDASFRLDLAFRDDITAISQLEQNLSTITSGQKLITISPSMDYVISNRVSLKLYFEQKRTIPKLSTSSPTITTRTGLQLRISLAQ
ncbi:MAG: cell surface protein SprA [Chitinophagaceae bacterium]